MSVYILSPQRNIPIGFLKNIYLFRFFFSMTTCTHLSPSLRSMPTTATTAIYRTIRFDFGISRLGFFIFLIILVVLVAAEVFLPIIFFVNWLGSHAARVSSRRRRQNKLADRLPPPPSSLPLTVFLTHSGYLAAVV